MILINLRKSKKLTNLWKVLENHFFIAKNVYTLYLETFLSHDESVRTFIFFQWTIKHQFLLCGHGLFDVKLTKSDTPKIPQMLLNSQGSLEKLLCMKKICF